MKKRNFEEGFSYIDVMVGMVILLIGITGLVSAITASVLRSHETKQHLVAKQIASSTLESIFSARDVGMPGGIDGWLKVGNVGANPDPTTGTPQGIFLTGFCPIRKDAGWDGVVGTVDDACPVGGPCSEGVHPANASAVTEGFYRMIEITDINDPDRPSPPFGTNPFMIRRIDITIKYPGAGGIREEKVSTIITNYK
jgi:type II secretory pathway pseudopilin PulG